ncbi:hypothetical protein GVN21_07295 [Caulobacter sp. SLTY]|uniref:DUF4238 domain-containing protein n=1 Tax=Caulobacter sp. SLTY TaxID=2683262 RepID=UPI00141315CF|nr:DUF4238 domain-containing protein [Caulobacter sp. SLTY]NBB15159.1 hypothetical protein [Caulobacter sp. SLTY]
MERRLKSERHHWWPECVSAHWADDKGGVNWLLPNGDTRRSTPANFGVIGNGHHILLGRPGEQTVWDESFEQEFDRADSNFPGVIQWLESVHHEPTPLPVERRRRFLPRSASDQELSNLSECLVSLAVRSPMTREIAVGLAEHLRGPLPDRERNVLIGSNLRSTHKRTVKEVSGRGKYVVIFSPDREFVFGDGFFHNITPPGGHALAPEMLVPVTPRLSVLFVVPLSYTVLPRVFSLTVSSEEADALNQVVQVYARTAIFYRNDRPEIQPIYAVGKHLKFETPDNLPDQIIANIPGVDTGDLALRRLFGR